MGSKTHFTVVRNEGYSDTEFKTRERHNERKNESYHNGDIVKERSRLNVHFQRYVFPDGTPETYEQTFDRLVATGRVVRRGLKPDAKVFDELVFDVNSAYFEENGGYEYAVEFFHEAYKLAVKEAGGEQYVLSAVMHADERNKDLSEKYGYDVFHYHLHVVYVPVVEKQIYYRKDCKDKEKAGQLKEVIPQISHSKKWPIKVQAERDGRAVTLNSYSLLQDRYHEHMKAAGFGGFERGERGSTAEHLEVLDYKIKQDKIRAQALSEEVGQKEETIIILDQKAEKKMAKIAKLDEQITVKEKAKATVAEVEAIGRQSVFGGGMTVTSDELKKLKTLAKKSVAGEERIAGLKKKMDNINRDLAALQKELEAVKRDRDHWRKKFSDLEQMVKPFLSAIVNFPKELLAFIASHWQERQQQQATKTKEETL